MESQPTAPKTPTQSPEKLPDGVPQESDASIEDAPLLQLLGQPLHEMEPEQLRAHVTNLRDITSSPITLKKSLTAKKAEEKASRATAPKESAASLTNKYLNLAKKQTP